MKGTSAKRSSAANQASMSVTIGSSRMPLLGMSLSPCCRFQTGEAPARNHWSKVDRITGPGDSQSVMRVNAKWPRKQMIPRHPAEIKMPHRSDFGTPCCLRPSFAGSAGSTGKIDRVTSGAHTSFQAKIFRFGNQSLARRRVRCDGARSCRLASHRREGRCPDAENRPCVVRAGSPRLACSGH
jgi:hypothetical protein